MEENSIISCLIQLVDRDDKIILQSSDKKECVNVFGQTIKIGSGTWIDNQRHGTIQDISYHILSEMVTPKEDEINWLGDKLNYSAIIKVHIA